MEKLIFLFSFSWLLINTSAQLSDPFDPFLNVKKDILTPEILKKNHVKSCTLFEGEMERSTVLYDENGRMLQKYGDKTFFIYDNKQKITVGHQFSSGRYVGKYATKHDENGVLTKIVYQYKSGISGRKQIETVLGYNGNVLQKMTAKGRIEDGVYDRSIEKIRSFKYNEDNSIKGIELINKITNSSADISETVFCDYKDGKLISKEQTMNFDEYIYDDEGKLIRIDQYDLYKKFANDPSLKTVPILKFEYNDKGLLSKKKDLLNNKTYRYEYEYCDLTNIEVKGSMEKVALFNYSQQFDNKVNKLLNNKTTIKVYPLAKELYVIQLEPQVMFPIIVTPGKDVLLNVKSNSMSFAKNDDDNTILLEIETAKRNSDNKEQDDKQQAIAFSVIITEKLRKYPEFIGFLYYTQFWDIQNNKQRFLDYTSKMLELYPLNFKANEAYSLMRK